MKNVRVIKDKVFKDYEAENLIIANKNTFKNWMCSAGTEGIYIDWDGVVWPATCFINDDVLKLGSIHDELPIKHLTDYVKCTSDKCFCMMEIYLPKYKFLKRHLTELHHGTVSLNDFNAISKSSLKNTKHIMWAFGRRCNFDCSYCDDYSHNKTDPLIEQRALNKVLDYANQYRDKKSIIWSFTGGEPTLNPNLLGLVKELNHLGDSISVSTNGSQNAEYYLELLRYACINISVHFEYLKINKLKKILEPLLSSELISTNPTQVGVNFMVLPGKVNLCVSYLLELKTIPNFDKYIVSRFDILRIKNSGQYHYYSDEEKRIINNLQNGIIGD